MACFPWQTYIDCLHIKKTDKSRMQNEDPMEVEMGSSRDEDDVNVDYQKKVIEIYPFLI